MSKWEEFFEKHRYNVIYGIDVNFTPEEMYQAIKDRMIEELLVDVQHLGNYGRLREK